MIEDELDLEVDGGVEAKEWHDGILFLVYVFIFPYTQIYTHIFLSLDPLYTFYTRVKSHINESLP